MKGVLIILSTFAFVLAGDFTAGAEPVPIHHGRGNTYDTSRMIEIKGTVTELYWRNPHITIFIDVTDENGETTNWIIEHSPIHRLARQGYNRNTVRPGMEVTAIINPGNGGTAVGLCHGIILADGTEVFNLRGARGLD